MKPSPGPISDWTKTPNGQLLFADELNHRILIQDSTGALRPAAGQFRYPRAVTVHGGAAFVADSWNHRIQAFQLPEWKFLFDFGGFCCPSSIAVMNGLLVIADTNNRRLSFHKPDGTFQFDYALSGFPRRVGVNADGSIAVCYDDGASETLEY